MMYLRLLFTGIPAAGAALLLAACVAGLGGDIPPPYLYPWDPATGEPAGEGPCLRLIKVAGE